MNSSSLLKVFLFIILVCTNCITEFEPPSQGYKNLLVVEALLSDNEDPFEVMLSRSIPIDTSALLPETGAEVRLYDESDEYVILNEHAAGTYLTNHANGQIGKAYRLYILTADGQQYESSMVTLRDTPDIDSVTYRYEEKPEAGIIGMQIYLYTHDPNDNTWYYRWDYDETWEFFTAYASTEIYEDGQILPRKDNIHRCWKNASSTAIILSTSKNLSEDIISEYPIHYVSTETDRLRVKYSLNVKQYSLSEESYNYWLELEKVTESLGTLFDPQPSTIYSNIRNISNEAEIVLGYFDASTVKEGRIFITRDKFPTPVRVPNYYRNCVDSIVSRGALPEMILSGYMLAYEMLNEFGFPVYVMSSPWCIDCRIAGTNERPEFWQ